VVDLELDNGKLEIGEVGLNWRIHEENDVGIIQIVYAGPNDIEFKILKLR